MIDMWRQGGQMQFWHLKRWHGLDPDLIHSEIPPDVLHRSAHERDGTPWHASWTVSHHHRTQQTPR